MGAPIPGIDIAGGPFPPVTNPNIVGNSAIVGGVVALPAGGLPPTPTSPAPPPPLVLTKRIIAARRESVVVTDQNAPAGLEVDANKVVGSTAIVTTPIANPPAGNEVDSGGVFTDGVPGGVGA